MWVRTMSAETMARVVDADEALERPLSGWGGEGIISVDQPAGEPLGDGRWLVSVSVHLKKCVRLGRA